LEVKNLTYDHSKENLSDINNEELKNKNSLDDSFVKYHPQGISE
jgi:hypothetical protein